jgi:hypothetical protein
MEYREPSEDADSPSPTRAFPFVRARGRLDVRRLLAASLITVSAAAVALFLGRQAVESAVSWLHAQPRYQVRFDQIELVPPPPAFFRGGPARFLERVRAGEARPEALETLSLLDVDRERIENVFKRSPWVEAVEGVEFPPRSLVVRLAYKEPTAVVPISSGEKVYLDRNGRILPFEDVDADRLGRTIQIRAAGVVSPSPDRQGLDWKTETPDRPKLAAIDRYVLQAAKLVGFLLTPERRREAEAAPGLVIDLIIPSTDLNEHQLYVRKEGPVLILWGAAPGDEQPGEPSAEEKWRILAEKTKKNALKAPKEADYWQFVRDDMQYHIPSSPSS